MKSAPPNRTACRWCGQIHCGGTCPKVKAMEFYPDGSVKRVEFYSPNDYPPIQILPGGAPFTTSMTWRENVHGR